MGRRGGHRNSKKPPRSLGPRIHRFDPSQAGLSSVFTLFVQKDPVSPGADVTGRPQPFGRSGA